MKLLRPLHAILALASLLTLPSPCGGADWPQWRGPDRDGRFHGAAWPDKLAGQLTQAWRVELGPSYSGPIVAGTRVFTTETREKKLETVRAFDRKTGKELWRTEWEGSVSVPFFAKSNGDWIRSTPATDGERIYVAGMRDTLVCLDVTNGHELWRKDFVAELKTPVPDFGFVCSPLVDGEAVYTQAGASLVRLDKRTGKIVWRSLQDQGGMWGSVFSSPTLATIAGRRQLLAQTREKLAGVDPENGQVLWEQPTEAFRGMNILTPVVHGDLVFTSTYGGKTTGFTLSQTNGQFSTRAAWTHKAQGYMSTPVVIDGIAYHHLKSQRLMAVDLSSGAELWTSGQSFGKYQSLVANGSRILALDQGGKLLLIDAAKDRLNLLDQMKVADAETWAHLAVTEEGVFIRELNALTSWRWAASAR